MPTEGAKVDPMKQKLEKWLGWMDTIQADIRGVLVAQRMHHELQEIIDTNSDLPETNDLYGRLGSTYTSHVVIGLRRQLKTGDEQVSLAAMFKEMIATPQAVTRTYYRSHYTDSNVADLAGGHFDQFASTGASHIDQSRVQADFDELKCVTAKCEEYADRRVAHMDKRKPRSAPTYLELDAAISTLDRLYVKYHRLLFAQSMTSLLPARQYDWTSVLRIPWIK